MKYQNSEKAKQRGSETGCKETARYQDFEKARPRGGETARWCDSEVVFFSSVSLTIFFVKNLSSDNLAS